MIMHASICININMFSFFIWKVLLIPSVTKKRQKVIEIKKSKIQRKASVLSILSKTPIILTRFNIWNSGY